MATESLVKVDRLKLLEDLKASLVKHTAEYNDQLTAYRASLREIYMKKIASIDAGEPINTSISIYLPANQEKLYREVIKTLEYSVDAHVQFTRSEFDNIKFLLN